MEKYVTPEKFAEISKGKKVESFPNEQFKQIGKDVYRVIPHNFKCTVEKVAKESYPWYLRMDEGTLSRFVKSIFGCEDYDVYRLNCDWFPLELVAGTEYGRYSSMTELSQKTGCLTFGYAGSGSAFFIGSKVNEAIKILRDNGFMFEYVK